MLLLPGAGCPSERASSTDGGGGLSSPRGMAAYLSNEPAVRKTSEWQYQNAPGLHISTAHYDIYTTLIDPLMLRQVPGFMEAAYTAYQGQLPEPIEVTTRLTVYLFGKRSEWEAFTRDFTGPQSYMYLKIKKGAYYLNDACVAYNIGRKQTFGVLAHEAWHQFNSKIFAFRLPSWLDEGIAMTYEIPVYANGTFTFDPGRNYGRLGALRKTIIDNNLIPLEHLIALNPGYIIDDSAGVQAFYAQSYALVRFLREDQYGRRLANYHSLLLAGLRGNWPLTPEQRNIAANRNIPLTAGFNAYVSTRLFEIYIGEDIDGIEEEYIRFCRKIVYHLRLQ